MTGGKKEASSGHITFEFGCVKVPYEEAMACIETCKKKQTIRRRHRLLLPTDNGSEKCRASKKVLKKQDRYASERKKTSRA
ncbi:hypothetical protein JTE90_012474 [Oedothorax gibbosus]|uniref:Uncharacterized protein n=1 Tax=Oedothorax gibbosus TaxID=931172 RepID=A0AAV6UF56_9ARAC|nr:hypothetical protein JTE90_012474 [Oedothorax gibbosus]